MDWIGSDTSRVSEYNTIQCSKTVGAKREPNQRRPRQPPNRPSRVCAHFHPNSDAFFFNSRRRGTELIQLERLVSVFIRVMWGSVYEWLFGECVRALVGVSLDYRTREGGNCTDAPTGEGMTTTTCCVGWICVNTEETANREETPRVLKVVNYYVQF